MTFKEFRDEKLKDPEFKAEYDALEPRYRFISGILQTMIQVEQDGVLTAGDDSYSQEHQRHQDNQRHMMRVNDEAISLISLIYWMRNEDWFTVDEKRDCLFLTSAAPQRAVESFKLYLETNGLPIEPLELRGDQMGRREAQRDTSTSVVGA